MHRLAICNYEYNRKIISGHKESDFKTFDEFKEVVAEYIEKNAILEPTSIDDVNPFYYRAHFKEGFESISKLTLEDLTRSELREVAEEYSDYIMSHIESISILDYINKIWK